MTCSNLLDCTTRFSEAVDTAVGNFDFVEPDFLDPEDSPFSSLRFYYRPRSALPPRLASYYLLTLSIVAAGYLQARGFIPCPYLFLKLIAEPNPLTIAPR